MAVRVTDKAFCALSPGLKKYTKHSKIENYQTIYLKNVKLLAQILRIHFFSDTIHNSILLFGNQTISSLNNKCIWHKYVTNYVPQFKHFVLLLNIQLE